jgi:hypothetical protein
MNIEAINLPETVLTLATDHCPSQLFRLSLTRGLYLGITLETLSRIRRATRQS